MLSGRSSRIAPGSAHVQPAHRPPRGAGVPPADTYILDAWGVQRASSGSTTNPFRYIGALGYFTEPDLGLHYVRARWLRPTTGSWLSVDPVRGQMRYGYVGARATGHLDATGLGRPLWCLFPPLWPICLVLYGWPWTPTPAPTPGPAPCSLPARNICVRAYHGSNADCVRCCEAIWTDCYAGVYGACSSDQCDKWKDGGLFPGCSVRCGGAP
jgi:RHS repeat-associated protein